MPRRSVLTDAEIQELFAFPKSPEGIVQHYTLSEEDVVVIRQHRGDPQRFGFAVMLCVILEFYSTLERQFQNPF